MLKKIKFAITIVVIIVLLGSPVWGASNYVGKLRNFKHKTEAAQNVDKSPFNIRAFHIPLKERNIRSIIKQASLRGYNSVIILIGSRIYLEEEGKPKLRSPWTDDKMRKIISYSRSLGVEPIMEIKCISKQSPATRKLIKKYPKLLIDKAYKKSVYNPKFRFPDGKDAFHGALLPLINHMLSWYGDNKPKYILLGVDEAYTDSLAEAGKRLDKKKTAAQVFAYRLNRLTSYLLKKNITPVIWGDKLLSTKLTHSGAVKGFKGDSRFKYVTSAHAEYHNSRSGQSTVKAMDYIKNKNDIIVADWHHYPVHNGEYPSVDYFQKMGFKDVWGAPQFVETGFREFARYGSKRGIGGMIATAYYVFTNKNPAFPSTINNSALYFIDPNFTPPSKPLISSYKFLYDDSSTKNISTNNSGKWITLGKGKNEFKVSAKLPKSIDAEHARAWLYDEGSKKNWIADHISIKDSQLHANFKINTQSFTKDHLVRLGMSYIDGNTGYLAKSEYPGVVTITGNGKLRYAGKNKNNNFITADFTDIPNLKGQRVIMVPGSYGNPLLILPTNSKTKSIIDGGLNTYSINGAYLYPKSGFAKQIINNGMKMKIEAKLTKDEKHRKKSSWYSFITYGIHKAGFRLLLGENNNLLLQFGSSEDNGTRTKWIKADGKMKLDKWEKIIVTVTPPDKGGNHKVTIKLGNNKTKTTVIHSFQKPLYYRPFALGVEYNEAYERGKITSKRRLRPNFPGLIRKVTIAPYK